jgi:DNA adenine methylase
MTTTLARLTLRRVTLPKVATRQKPRGVAQPARPAAAGPIVKWVGGKTKLLPEIERRMPTSYRRYFEPFFGGGALFFHIQPQTAILGDYNRDLINMYRCVSWNVEGVLRRLQSHRRRHDKTYYYATREAWNDPNKSWGNVERAATFIYLNKTCFNGLWRVNKKGEFNVPMGRYKSPSIYRPDAVRSASKLLRRTELFRGGYLDCVERAESGDFIYFDPPYHPINATSKFVSYTAGNFSEADQEELARTARMLSDRGCAVMLSNNDTPFIRKIYEGFKIEQVMCPRAINSKASARGAVPEVLIRNYD